LNLPLNTKKFKDKKLNGARNNIGMSFAILGSISAEIKPFNINVLDNQKAVKFKKYLKLDFICLC
jgi:hypothetical protein